MYYLDKINTKNKTALFVKELREDSFGKNLKFRFTNPNYNRIYGRQFLGHTGYGDKTYSLKFTNPRIDVKEDGVEYEREYSLKLSKIILVNTEDGKNLSKNTSTSSGNLASFISSINNIYTPNDTCSPNWESEYFRDEYGNGYTYDIHSEKNVLDSRDIPSNFIAEKALKVVEFNHSYDLAKNSPSSSEINTSNSDNKDDGKLKEKAVILIYLQHLLIIICEI